MFENSVEPEALCSGCVYYPPNLPPNAYSLEDWVVLQARSCSFEQKPGDTDCLATRKTSCSLVNLEALKQLPG